MNFEREKGIEVNALLLALIFKLEKKGILAVKDRLELVEDSRNLEREFMGEKIESVLKKGDMR